MENPGMLQEAAGLGLRSFQRFRDFLRIRKVGKRELPGKKSTPKEKQSAGKVGNFFIPSKILPLEWGVEAKGHGNSWNSWNSWNSGMVWLGRTLRIVPSQSLPIPTFPGLKFHPCSKLASDNSRDGAATIPTLFSPKNPKILRPSLQTIPKSRIFFPFNPAEIFFLGFPGRKLGFREVQRGAAPKFHKTFPVDLKSVKSQWKNPGLT